MTVYSSNACKTVIHPSCSLPGAAGISYELCRQAQLPRAAPLVLTRPDHRPSPPRDAYAKNSYLPLPLLNHAVFLTSAMLSLLLATLSLAAAGWLWVPLVDVLSACRHRLWPPGRGWWVLKWCVCCLCIVMLYLDPHARGAGGPACPKLMGRPYTTPRFRSCRI